jgi:alpha-methylacyl-CoA racemase
MGKVLEGVRIVEIAGIGPGPFCGMLLADLGADVITIERPSADIGAARPKQIVNRGKRSIVLDLKSPEAIEVVLQLVNTADALIEGMRPGVMERLGLGPDICQTRNPALVYGRMTGWGQSGPLSQAAGHDSNYTALAGGLWHTSPDGVRQHAPPTVMGDIGGGALYLAIGLLAGILEVRSGSKGRIVDAAIVDGTAHMLNLLLGMVATLGGDYDKRNMFSDLAHWAGRSYRCSDEKWINIAPLEPQFYAQFVELMGLSDDERFVKGQMDPGMWPALTEELTVLFSSRTQAQWCDVLEGSDCCFAPVLDPMAASRHPHMAARQTYQNIDGVLQAAPAPRFSGAGSNSVRPIPKRGEHGREILAEVGISEHGIAALVTMGAAKLD